MYTVIKESLKKGCGFYHKICLALFLLCSSINIFAAMPGAPTINGAGDAGDFIKTGQAVTDEGTLVLINFLYVFSIIGYCGGLLWMLHQAKKKEEWGGFVKYAFIGLIVLVLILVLLNSAKTALTP